MTGVASQSCRMFGTHNLGKPLRLRTIGLVAAHANDCGVRQGRSNRTGVVGVLGERPVASLTGERRVFTLFLQIGDVGVTRLTSFVTGNGNRTRRYLSNGCATIVAVLPEATGNNSCAQNHEREERDQHHCSEPDQVFYVLEQVRLPKS